MLVAIVVLAALNVATAALAARYRAQARGGYAVGYKDGYKLGFQQAERELEQREQRLRRNAKVVMLVARQRHQPSEWN